MEKRKRYFKNFSFFLQSRPIFVDFFAKKIRGDTSGLEALTPGLRDGINASSARTVQ